MFIIAYCNAVAHTEGVLTLPYEMFSFITFF